MTPVDSGGRYYGLETPDTARSGLAPQTITATGTSALIAAQDIASLLANPIAGGPVTGTTPSLVLTLQHTEDGTTFYTVGSSFPAITGVTAVGAVEQEFEVSDYGQLRWSWVVTGTTPSFGAFHVETTIKKIGDA